MARHPRKPPQHLVPSGTSRQPDTGTSGGTRTAPASTPLPLPDTFDERLKKLEKVLSEFVSRRGVPRDFISDAMCYRAMRWHMRDGNAPGQPPWYYDTTHALRRAHR